MFKRPFTTSKQIQKFSGLQHELAHIKQSTYEPSFWRSYVADPIVNTLKALTVGMINLDELGILHTSNTMQDLFTQDKEKQVRSLLKESNIFSAEIGQSHSKLVSRFFNDKFPNLKMDYLDDRDVNFNPDIGLIHQDGNAIQTHKDVWASIDEGSDYVRVEPKPGTGATIEHAKKALVEFKNDKKYAGIRIIPETPFNKNVDRHIGRVKSYLTSLETGMSK